MATMKIGIRNKKRYGRYKMYEVDALGFKADIRMVKEAIQHRLIEHTAAVNADIATVARFHGVPQKVVRKFAGA